MKYLLTLRSWIVFAVVALPAALPLNYLLKENHKAAVISLCIWILLLLSWLNAAGINMFIKFREKMKINLSFFRFNIGYLYIYTIILSAALYMQVTGKLEERLSNPAIGLVVMVPMTIYAIIALLNAYYFVALLIVSSEARSIVSFKSLSKEFVLMIFFPVGIWFLHPRIAKIISKKRSAFSSANIATSDL